MLVKHYSQKKLTRDRSVSSKKAALRCTNLGSTCFNRSDLSCNKGQKLFQKIIMFVCPHYIFTLKKFLEI